MIQPTIPYGAIREERAGFSPAAEDLELVRALHILRDLASVSDEVLPRVLARYTVTRFWLLRLTGAPYAMVAGTRRSADGFLALVEDGWREGRFHRALLARPEPIDRGVRLLRVAAASAAADGHEGSADGLTGAAFIGALAGGDHGTAAVLAGGMARSHTDRGAAVDAILWRVRAHRAASAPAGRRPED